ncbi:MAG: proprotein convertase P-domain-containing protein [Bradymonadales bacterium]|nr:proprotein convertase P-domain-containing protein [Bradymonadales bacterium]
MHQKFCWILLALLATELVACAEAVLEVDAPSSRVSVPKGLDIQTDHPYLDDEEQSWDITAPTEALSVTIVFDRFETEEDYDFVTLSTGDGQVIHELSGTLSGQSFTVPGSVMHIDFTSDWLITRWGFAVTQYSFEIEETPHPTDHRPYCGAIGSRSEGWYWGDTGQLIRWTNCASLDAPECGAIGSRSEGWYSNGEPALIAWDNCHRTVRLALVGEVCGPSIGYSCYGDAYCQGVPTGRIGGTGTCRPYGYCETESDCDLGEENPWIHPACVGHATCESNQCAWHCGPSELGPWSWTAVLLRDVESAHPYVNDFDQTWDVVRQGAERIKVHFQRIETEAYYDYLVLSGNREERALNLSGAYQDYWTPEFGGDTVHINLQTDYSVTKWGFSADMVSYYEQLPYGSCNTTADCPPNESCFPHHCFNPYAPCYGHCERDSHCDDGTTPACRRMIPICPEGTILAYQSSCYYCVDPGTCQVPVTEEGDACDDSNPCPEGLYCKAMANGAGICHGERWCQASTVESDCANLPHIAVPGYWACYLSECSWQTGFSGGSFNSTERVSIPDADTAGIESSIEVSGLSPCDVEVAMDLTIQHTYRGDLVVGLTDPTGVRAVLSDRQGGSADDLVLSGLILPETIGASVVNGSWTLDVADVYSYDTGTLESWGLRFTCR